jgi:hypothetical protein
MCLFVNCFKLIVYLNILNFILLFWKCVLWLFIFQIYASDENVSKNHTTWHCQVEENSLMIAHGLYALYIWLVCYVKVMYDIWEMCDSTTLLAYSYNESQRDALFLRFIWWGTLHVSDMSTVHHQEYLNTLYTQQVLVILVLLASASRCQQN